MLCFLSEFFQDIYYRYRFRYYRYGFRYFIIAMVFVISNWNNIRKV